MSVVLLYITDINWERKLCYWSKFETNSTIYDLHKFICLYI